MSEENGKPRSDEKLAEITLDDIVRLLDQMEAEGEVETVGIDPVTGLKLYRFTPRH